MQAKDKPWKQKELMGFMLFLLSTVWIFFNGYEVLPIGFIISIIVWKTLKCKKIVLVPIFLGFILGTVGTGFYVAFNLIPPEQNLHSDNSRGEFFAGGRIGISIPKYFLSDEQKLQSVSGLIIYDGDLDSKTIQSINQVTDEFIISVNTSDVAKAKKVFGAEEISESEIDNLKRILSSFYGQYGNIHSAKYLGYERVDIMNKELSEEQIAIVYEITSDTGVYKYWYSIYQKEASHWYLENIQSLSNDTVIKVKAP